ncbi:MAG: hypothetical protein FD175_443 [Beijerinckiaceae bacterium]|nr:MAG: hypothetical protein FD175_443 [Beijerinckiaceae bacterium]
MARYTVHVPTQPDARAEALERAVFVRDGWSWGGFFFGPFWLLWHRNWLVGLLATIVVGLLFAVLVSQPIAEAAKVAAVLLIAFLWGLEGASLRRAALAFAGYREEALVVGDNLDEIERRFFLEADAGASPAAPPAGISPPPVARGPWDQPVIGLFPDARKHP